MSSFIYNAFTSKALIDIANRELKAAGARVRISRVVKSHKDVLPGLIQVKTHRGADALMHVWNYGNRLETLCVRGIHRIVHRNGKFGLLPNGQPTKGLQPYIFNGEMGNAYVASEEDIALFFTRTFDGVDADIVNKRIADAVDFANRALNGPLEAIRIAA